MAGRGARTRLPPAYGARCRIVDAGPRRDRLTVGEVTGATCVIFATHGLYI
jgi:hypothetical protein